MHERKGVLLNSLKLFKFMEMKTSMHKRSKSDPAKRRTEEVLKLNNIFEASRHHHKLDMGQLDSWVEAKKRPSPGIEVQNSLKEEILQLQKQLEDQFVVRCALEKALSYRPISCNPTNENSITKPTNDLIKEIAVLELEVVYLEKYLLSMYRKTFDQRVSPLSTMDNSSKSTSAMHKGTFLDPGQDTTSNKENILVDSCRILLSQDSKDCNDFWRAQTLVDSSIHRSHSSLSQRACSVRPSSPRGVPAEAVNSYHSLPLSMLERAQGGTSNVISLAEHFSSCISDQCSRDTKLAF
ncbi:hypothetical protein F0562_020618 [Nyssa sinensis]|uniref:Ternary complex factor MIP1 leucine-zipper domain-containing protein n=1 Tax=Nyssa sinensis TaxID=561372 RepID=A0A5J5BX81_9ASTE|nr:hypothetical protein F0562_020618 [Nyssa sinensis]